MVGERFSFRPVRIELRQQFAKMGFFQQVQFSRAIAGGETPDIGLTHEAAQGRLFVTEVDEVHRDDLVNDAG